MRYEKPVVVNLNAGARAAGQEPLGCYDGAAATGGAEVCYAGGNPYMSLMPCWPGSDPLDGGYSSDCIGGTNAYYCEAGSGAMGGNDPDGCRNGPSVVF